MPTRRLLRAEPEHTVADVMNDNVVAIPDWATVLIASEYFATRRLLAFPVVNPGASYSAWSMSACSPTK